MNEPRPPLDRTLATPPPLDRTLAAPAPFDRTVAAPPPGPGASGRLAPLSPSGRLARQLVAGAAFGEYDLVAELGRGGMGAVFRARERRLGRSVAIKVMLDGADPVTRERFRREGEVAASLDHPGIVRVHQAGEVNGVPFMACELVEGARSLAAAAVGLAPAARGRLVLDAAHALAHAHARGVVHRDVKPDNLLVDATGRVRVADFGIAASLGHERLTMTGALLGTPSYMAPEQIDGARAQIGPWTDVWALGVVLHELVAGQLPFVGGSLAELSWNILDRPAPPLGDPALAPVCARALAKAPAARYPDAAAFASDLERAVQGQRTDAGRAARAGRARRGLALSSLLAALGLGGAAAWRFASEDPPPPTVPPRLTLTSPQDDVRTLDDEVVVRGTITDDDAWVDVSVNDGPAVRVERGAPFKLTVALAQGPNHLVVAAVDASGLRAAPVHRSVVRGAPPLPRPAWWDQVADRPALPLPEGLSFGEARGEYRNERDGSVLVWIPPGTFTMGGTAGNMRYEPHVGDTLQGPETQRVRLSRGFFLGKYEVTVRQFRAYTTETGAVGPMKPNPDDHPVWYVDWEQAHAYCRWAGLRLPTEAEWEWAATGPDGRPWPWGKHEPTTELVNMIGDDGHARSAPVGSFPLGASAWGCLDMGGNVAELVADWLGPYQDTVEPLVDPRGPPSGTVRGRRGGHWLSQVPDGVRGSYRGGAWPASRGEDQGFRVCRSPD